MKLALQNLGILGALTLLSGCVQPNAGWLVAPQGPAPVAERQTAGAAQQQDRLSRFRRLGGMEGAAPPDVQQITLPPGAVPSMAEPVPVVRVVFPERTFFGFDAATPFPSAAPILDAIAANMRQDAPDTALTVLGHTDAVGSDAYNTDLSRRRAASVMAALVARGVNPEQLSEVAIGKRQPVAPNDTEEGRALNRRVEFLVSPALAANLAAIQQGASPRTPSVVNVYQPAAEGNGELRQVNALSLGPVAAETVAPAAVARSGGANNPVRRVTAAPVAPPAPVTLITPDEVAPRDLDPAGPSSY